MIWNIDIKIILFLLFTIILLISIIIITYLCGKIKKLNFRNMYYNNYNKKNIFFLKEYGNCKVKRIYYANEPISEFAEFVINLATFYYFKNTIKKYDNFYPLHSSFIFEIELENKLTKYIMIEKNNTISINDNFKLSTKKELQNLHIKKNKYTLLDILENTRKRLGDHTFFNWQLKNNNCQFFSEEILKTLKKTKYSKIQKQFFNNLNLSDFAIHSINIGHNMYILLNLDVINKIRQFF